MAGETARVRLRFRWFRMDTDFNMRQRNRGKRESTQFQMSRFRQGAVRIDSAGIRVTPFGEIANESGVIQNADDFQPRLSYRSLFRQGQQRLIANQMAVLPHR